MKVLVLGAGPAQIDLITYLVNQGHEVVVSSSRSSAKPIMDQVTFELVDITDVNGVVNVATRHRADVIYSVGSDLAMPTVAEVSGRLGLPRFNDSQIAQLFQNKAEMRRLFEGSEFGVRFASANTVEELLGWSTFPAIMKPVDSQGQRGITMVRNREDILGGFGAAASASPSRRVILEEFLVGQEYSVNIFLKDGTMEFFLPSRRISFAEYPGGIIKEHVFDHSGDLDDPIRRLAEDLVGRTGITDGPLYLQVKADGAGRPKLVEAAARLDGCHLWRAIKEFCGQDLLDATLRQLGGLPRRMPPQDKNLGKTTPLRLKFLMVPPETRVTEALYSEIPSTAIFSERYFVEGHIVGRQNGYREKIGYWIERL